MTRIALILALAAGAAGFALMMMYKQSFEDSASGGPPVAVVVATKDLPLGSELTEEMIAVRELPSTYVEDRHIRADDARRILGVRVSMGVRANESLLWTDLATTSVERRDLSGLVRNGMRAVTVRASRASTFGGLLRPGDRVDVLLTTERHGELVTIPLLQNLLVLAVGKNMGDAAGTGVSLLEGKPDVTLSATVAQAQALTHASNDGSLTVILRNPDDIAVARDLPETTAADIMEPEKLARIQTRRVTKPAVEPPQPTQPASTVEIEHVR